MALSLNPERLKKYKDIILLILKHGSKEMVDKVNKESLPEGLEYEGEIKNEDGNPEQLAKDLEAMGPTFIKLGQLLSTRADFLPTPYIEALSRLQDNVAPFGFDEVEKIVEEELSVRISKGFLEFDDIPIAAASLGQVHKAVLRNGTPVAVKIQRPGIVKLILDDLQALDDIISTLDKNFEAARRYSIKNILDEFRKTLLSELSYKQEAENLKKMHSQLINYDLIIVPRPIDDYTTNKVLTMEYVKGLKVTKLSPLRHIEINGELLAEQLFKAYLDQVLVHGFFHADPHPGNVFLTEDNKIALLDLGMVARLDTAMREKLLKLLLHVSEGRGLEASEVTIQLCEITSDFDKNNFIKKVSEFVTRTQDATLQQIQVGRVVLELTRIASENGIRASSELAFLGKTLLNLDGIGKTLSPNFNPNEVIRSHTEFITQEHLKKTFSTGNLVSILIEGREFIQKLPKRLNSILDGIAENKLEIKVRAFDENNITDNLLKIANRITTGLILAALIIGAALLIRVPSSFNLLGYPGMAIILFLIAAGLGLGLVLSIMLKDRRYNKKNNK